MMDLTKFKKEPKVVGGKNYPQVYINWAKDSPEGKLILSLKKRFKLTEVIIQLFKENNIQ